MTESTAERKNARKKHRKNERTKGNKERNKDRHNEYTRQRKKGKSTTELTTTGLAFPPFLRGGGRCAPHTKRSQRRRVVRSCEFRSSRGSGGLNIKIKILTC